MSDAASPTSPVLSEIAMTSTPLLDTIIWGPGLADNNIAVYFAPEGYSVPGPLPFGPLRNVVSEGFNAYEIAQFEAAFAAIEAVIDVTFTIVNDPGQADLTLVLDTNEVEGAFLGIFNQPGERDEGIGIFDGTLWDRTPGGDLEAGGYGYVTIVHELLHGMGLAHPHDNGGVSTVMPGVTSAFDDYGDDGLNQGVYTTMTYNSGFPDGGDRAQTNAQPGVNYGFEAGPMALDIAALQVLYGANTTHASGNDSYVLPTANAVGTYWSSIWDTGGIDEIRHDGATGAEIDLRSATLEFEPGGGGFISAVNGIAGGFTIAHNVTIENAVGGSGADRLVGNDTGNRLEGREGQDTLLGAGGNDTLIGGTGNDNLQGAAGNDQIWAGAGDTGNDLLTGGAGNDTLGGGAGNDTGLGGDGADVLYGGAGNDDLDGGAAGDVAWAGAGADRVAGASGHDTLGGGNGVDTLEGDEGNDVLYASLGNDTAIGGSGDDEIFGGDDADILTGGAGHDTMYGGEGDDVFIFAAGHGNDYIGGFETRGDNTIDLQALNLAGFGALTLTQEADGVVVQTGAGTITLWGTVLAEITSDDFLF